MEKEKKKPLWLKITLWVLFAIVLLTATLSLSYARASCDSNGLTEKEIEFTVEDKKGNSLSLHEIDGPIVVNFWAIWCPPCKKELPVFQEVYDEYKNEVSFVFVNVLRWQGDTVEDVEAFLQQNGYTFPTYYDVDREAEEACNVSSIPLTVFIGRDGKVKKTYSGSISKMVLRNTIKDIL